MIQEWEHTAGNLIYHFRSILRGNIPFSLSSDFWHSNRRKAPVLRENLPNAEALDFVRQMATLIDSHQQELLAARHRGVKDAQPFLWLAELFLG